MKILAMVHGYPPEHNAGAEWMLHEMLKYMVSCGHQAKVIIPLSIKPYDFEGVQVAEHTYRGAKEDVQNADIVISHLDRSGKALNFAEFFHKPYVHLVHNSNFFDAVSKRHKENVSQRWVYVIYNSEFTKRENAYLNPSIVVHPPVDYRRYRVTKKIKPVTIEDVKPKGRKKVISIDSKLTSGNKITLVNLFWKKGGVFFHELARMMPDREFLGVEGWYGKQERAELGNVTYMSPTHKAKTFYAQTRILIMPSMYESYGRVAIEAMCSGIPVIAAPTEGLKESIGEAGIFCDLNNHQQWIDAIKRLDDEKEYEAVSHKCIEYSKQVEKKINNELAEMEKFFTAIINKKI